MSFCHFCLSESKKYLSTDETDTFLLLDAVFLFFWAKELPLLHFTFQLFRSFVQVFARWLPRVRRGGQMRRNFWPSQFVFVLRRTAFLFFPAFDQFDFRKKWKKVASFAFFQQRVFAFNEMNGVSQGISSILILDTLHTLPYLGHTFYLHVYSLLLSKTKPITTMVYQASWYLVNFVMMGEGSFTPVPNL